MRWMLPLLVLSASLLPVAAAQRPLLVSIVEVVCMEDGEVHLLQECQGDVTRLCEQQPELCWAPPPPVDETLDAARASIPLSTRPCANVALLVATVNGVRDNTVTAYCP